MVQFVNIQQDQQYVCVLDIHLISTKITQMHILWMGNDGYMNLFHGILCKSKQADTLKHL